MVPQRHVLDAMQTMSTTRQARGLSAQLLAVAISADANISCLFVYDAVKANRVINCGEPDWPIE